VGRHYEEQSLALLREVHQRSSSDERWGELHAGQKDRILVFPIDRIHNLALIGPEPSFETFLRQMLRQGSAPGAGPDDSYAMDRWHDLKVFLTGGVISTRFVSHADYRNRFFPLSMNERRPLKFVKFSQAASPYQTASGKRSGTCLAPLTYDFTISFVRMHRTISMK
jgi:hypothetical protein